MAEDSLQLLSVTLLRAHGVRSSNPVHAAVDQRQTRALEYLLERGPADLVDEQLEGWTLLQRAARSACMEGDVGFNMMELLLRHGAQPNIPCGPCSEVPLHEVARRCAKAGINLLIKWDANPNAVNDEGCTALHIACRSQQHWFRKAQAVEALLAAGADPTRRDSSGRLPRESLEGESAPEAINFKGSDRILQKAECWWRRRAVVMARARAEKVEHPLLRLPEVHFQAIVRFI